MCSGMFNYGLMKQKNMHVQRLGRVMANPTHSYTYIVKDFEMIVIYAFGAPVRIEAWHR